jgi:two-component system sensor histidine kinase AlgZ
MHPILADPRRLGLYLAAWLPVAGIVMGLFMLAGAGWAGASALALPLVAPFAFACLSSWYVCRTLPLHDTHFARLMGTHLGTAVLSTSLWLLVGRGWARALSDIFPGIEEPFVRQTPPLLAMGTLLFLLATALSYTLIALEEQRRAERHALEIQVLAREAEVTALRAQLQPHFLFNSLNSISALTSVDSDGARRMCLLLAEFLRSSLALGVRETIPLSEELALLSSFLAVEKVRYGTRLDYEQHVDDDVRGCLIPPLLLQPLVENSVTHGIAHLVDGGCVVIDAHRRGRQLEIAVTNPCDPDRARKPGAGVGLDNVRRRLQAWHGRDALLRIRDAPASFRVELSLPAE